jgi:hypothetical protein
MCPDRIIHLMAIVALDTPPYYRRDMFLVLGIRSMLHMPQRYNDSGDGTLRMSLSPLHLHYRLFAAIYIRFPLLSLYIARALRDNTYMRSTSSYLLLEPSLLCYVVHIHNSSDKSLIPILMSSKLLPLFYPHNGQYMTLRSTRISTIYTGL